MRGPIDTIRRVVPLFHKPKNPNDFVGVYDASIEEVEEVFRANGLKKNPVSFLSYKKRFGFEKASWAWWEWKFATRKYHFILFTGNDGTRVYCHEEYNWKRHPIKHIRMKNIDIPSGVHFAGRMLRESELDEY